MNVLDQDLEEDIASIVESYDLPLDIRNRVIRTARRRLQDSLISGFSVSGFDDIYEEIAIIVEECGIPYKERFSLDGKIKDSDNSFLNFFQGEGENPTIKEQKLPIEQVIGILEKEIGNTEFLRHLIKEASANALFVKATPEEIIDAAPEIQGKVEKIARKYEVNGRILIPKRPIISVNFNFPSLVQFGRRLYHGNPLAFFRENIKTYEGMNRTKFHKFDPGLSEALRQKGQLDKAIPFKNGNNFRCYPSAWDYYLAHQDKYKDKGPGQISVSDKPLYDRLWKEGKTKDIKKAQRTYRGFLSPWDYFEVNMKTFRGMTPKKFEQYDEGLLKALRRKNQFQRAMNLLKTSYPSCYAS